MSIQTCPGCGRTLDERAAIMVKSFLTRIRSALHGKPILTTIIELPGPMYNIVHGTNRYAMFWLGMLALPPGVLDQCFRDCFLQRGRHGELEICIYTRDEGDNAALSRETEVLRTHPLYVFDYRDEHDKTYVTYVFRPTAVMRPTLEFVVARDPEVAVPPSHVERSEAVLRKVESASDDPEVQRVRSVLRTAPRYTSLLEVP